jgi:hypothetical protein
MLNKYIILGSSIAVVAAYGAGYYKGSDNEAIHNTINQQATQLNILNKVIANERLAVSIANKKSTELAEELNTERLNNDSIKKQIKKGETSINKLNNINREFVRYIQVANGDNVSQVTRVASESSNPHSAVPPDRVLYYTVDLLSAFNQCRLHANKLIRLYNEQRALN